MKSGASIFHRIAPWAGFVLWAIVLWKCSSVSGREIRLPGFLFADKLIHTLYFFAGGVLLARPLFESFRLRGWRLVLVVVIIMGAIGLSDEIHQLSTPMRSGGDRGDWLADFSGALLAGLAMAWAYRPVKHVDS